ncbi:hypothetical protein HDU87_006229 [Geranomyces variabilis]|uniref:Ribosomal protein S8 n=1 Tax=Geranomyces variabilis TaxID=109894 RepID=A0AAD5TGE7_9FUNG|nr:hypothetical protein HDU87_006229 [Geranomyces variabilis]
MAPVHNLCSMVQNSFRWKLRQIAVPVSATNRAICRILYDEGFISALEQGSSQGPHAAVRPLPHAPAPSAPRASSTSSATAGEPPRPPPFAKPAFITTTSQQLPQPPSPNPASQKLWLTLKYKDGEPVLRKMSAVSKPSRRVFASLAELRAVAAARRAAPLLKGQEVGQVTILDTPYGIIELKEALEKEVGGEVLCIAA